MIVGGGTAGWMARPRSSKVMGEIPSFVIELVESEEIGTVGVGEATIPQIKLFTPARDRRKRVHSTRPTRTYKLGIEFRDWTGSAIATSIRSASTGPT